MIWPAMLSVLNLFCIDIRMTSNDRISLFHMDVREILLVELSHGMVGKKLRLWNRGWFKERGLLPHP